LSDTSDLLDKLDPPALSIERIAANTAATFLAFLADLKNKDIHKKGAEDCPLFYNNDRRIEAIAGPLRFCQICSRKLKLQPDLLAALEALLRVYP